MQRFAVSRKKISYEQKERKKNMHVLTVEGYTFFEMEDETLTSASKRCI
jgi:hypothetical protein